MGDQFQSVKDQNSSALSAPIRGVYDVTPNDGADLPDGNVGGDDEQGVTRGLWVETLAGPVKMTLDDGSIQTLTLEAQKIHPFRVKKVFATGTTATGIKALY